MKKKEMEAQLAEVAALLFCEPDEVASTVRSAVEERDREFEALNKRIAEVGKKADRFFHDHKVAERQLKLAKVQIEKEAKFFERLGREAAQLEEGARFQVRSKDINVDINIGDFGRLKPESIKAILKQRAPLFKAVGGLLAAGIAGITAWVNRSEGAANKG